MIDKKQIDEWTRWFRDVLAPPQVPEPRGPARDGAGGEHLARASASLRALLQDRSIRVSWKAEVRAPLREILLITTGPVALLRDELLRIPGIEVAFLHGSFAARMSGQSGPAPHDIDVMVLGEPDPEQVYDACTRVEEAVRRPVNPTIITSDEFTRDTGFHTQVRTSPTVPIIGERPWT